jgi:membrane protease YdiL (CAAX protease family)
MKPGSAKYCLSSIMGAFLRNRFPFKEKTVAVLLPIALLTLLLILAIFSRGTLADRNAIIGIAQIAAAGLAGFSFVVLFFFDSRLGPSLSPRFSRAKFWYVNLIGVWLLTFIVVPVFVRGDWQQIATGAMTLSYRWSASLFEEVIFRVLIFRGLMLVKYSWRVSAVVSSVLFCVAHLYSAELGHFVNGLVFCAIYFLTGSLLLVTVSHALLNIIVENFNCNKVEAALCGLPFSPEINSVLSTVGPFGFVALLALVALIEHDRYQKKKAVV